MRCDFHLHTHCSDGLLPPRDLLVAVRRQGVSWFAVTDHDTLAGFAALRGSIGLIPGVEVTTSHDQREVHVVGLGIDPDHREFIAFLAGIRLRRRERLQLILARLPAAVARSLTMADLDDGRADALGRLHVARALVKRGGVASVQAAFLDHLGDEHAHDSQLPPYPALADGCRAIQAAGGVAILAHPGVYGDIGTIAGLVAQGCDGIEVNHPHLDPALAGALQQLAATRNLLVSSGSDLHYLGHRRPGMWSLDDQAHAPLLVRLGIAA